MNLIEPVLFPVNPDIFNTLKFLEDSSYTLKECDIFLNYNYQVKEYMLLTTYVDSALMEEFDLNIRGFRTYEDVVMIINDHMYGDYFRYFFFKYLLDRGDFVSTVDLSEFLQNKHSFAIKKKSRTQLIYDLEDHYYNTIVIPELWDIDDPNRFNRLFKEPANYFDQKKTIKKAWDQLMMGGKMYVLRSQDYGKVIFNIGDDFTEINAGVFQKDYTREQKTNELKLWL
jgi:hypothetical protein